MPTVTITVNGQPRSADVEPRTLLVHFIRENLGLTGTHVGCDTTSCGACTIHWNGVPVKSCTVFAVQADGEEITTVEGLAQGGTIAVALLAAGCAPLALAGQGTGLAQAYVGAVGRFPQVTNRAYNLWWLLLRGASRSDQELLAAGLTYRMAGLLLVGGAALLVCLALLRRADGPARAEGAAVIALSFFLLPTQIHERYLFFALAFLVLRAASDRRLLLAYLALVATATLNILGALSGFSPAATAAIAAMPWLPMAIAAANPSYSPRRTFANTRRSGRRAASPYR